MKNKNHRDLEKHWADQARKKTAAEQLRVKMEKLREKMKADQKSLGGDQPANELPPKAAAPPAEPESKPLKSSGPAKARAKQ